ncbi:ATP-dependent DNA helicase [Natronosporangium hydrolyticum]|uniref:ATP-dependent DNA helicase n=1 Tax=Natronosporangium hydrolyticum TaxID=2811111 RepID=A0A895YQM9_9ACTN|nr:ATP-dependent DNA helicase [Natronosporangium hydrolyticum]QSB17056.1 ATP-dependent DNA helicase [Natronosporangium hydrolyticum]
MAAAVAGAVERKEHLLVQAGTGTGKSLAYLVPSLLVDGPVVISTATLALQSQLVDHDLPRLVAAAQPVLGRRPSFAVLKGRHHYLCLAKLDGSTEEEPADALFDAGGAGGEPKWIGESGRLGKQIERIRDWAMETSTGDRDELDPGVDETAWRQVSMPARECVGAAKCPWGAECFAELSRERARAADLVVTNHSLLAVDMLAGRHIVPPHKLLVVDEAHELADRVSSAAQAELTAEAVDRGARRCRTLLEPEIYEALVTAGDALTVGLGEAPVGRLAGPLPAPLHEACTLVDAATRAALTAIGEVKSDDPEAVGKQPARAALEELSSTAQRLIAADDADVAWVEKPTGFGGGRRQPALVVAPLSVAGTLTTHLFEDRVVVATSATLALGGAFDTVARTLGLAPGTGPADAGAGSGAGALPWRGLDVGSPFDYPKQGILYVAAHLPRPKESGLPEASAEELVRLVTALGGRTLGLFSSRRAAERAAEVLRSRTKLEVLLQGEESLPLLVRRFREDPDSCLLGVMSLWQGVDVPGDACQLVVIDRLPFPRPDEPLAAARSAAVDAAGGSGFASVSVPIAAVRLAQGAGRLVRTGADRGVVAVLDSRLHTARGYGSYLRKSLPPFWYTTDPAVVTGALTRLAG